MTTQKVFSSRALNVNADTYVGEAGRLFYAQPNGSGTAPVLKYSDGVTPGGLPLSGGSLTFSGDAPPTNPSEGNLWWNTVDGRLYIWYDSSWVDASPDITNTATDVTLTLLSVSTSTAVGAGALSYNNQSGVFTYHPADLSSFLTATDLSNYVNTASINLLISNSLTNFVYTGTITYNQISGVPDDIDAYTTTATVQLLISNSLTNYATQLFVTSQGFITTSSLSVTTLASGTNELTYDNGVFTFTPTDLSTYATQTWVNNKNYLTVDTGITGLIATPNQTTVTNNHDGTWQVGTVQDIGSSSTVYFGNLTVNNLNVLSTITNTVPVTVEGYRLYLASTATSRTQIEQGGIQLGTSTFKRSILYTYNGGNDYWYTDPDTGFYTEHLVASTSTLQQIYVEGTANIGYSNLGLSYLNALVQIDSSAPNYTQLVFQNHSTSSVASGDLVVTADIGTDGTNFVDMGIAGSNWDGTQEYSLGTAVLPFDGYLYTQGNDTRGVGNLVIGTLNSGTAVKINIDGTLVSTFTTSSFNVDNIQPLTADGDLDINKGGLGYLVTPRIKFPVATTTASATMLTGDSLLVLNILAAQISSSTAVTWSVGPGDYIPQNTYGNSNGINAPWTVIALQDTPVIPLLISDVVAGAGIPVSSAIQFVGTGTYSNIIIIDSTLDGLPITPPAYPGLVTFERPTINNGISIITTTATDITLNAGAGGSVISHSDLLPFTTNSWSLGSPSKRWKNAYFGPATIFIEDPVTGVDIGLGGNAGNLVVEGAAGFQAGSWLLRGNEIAITDLVADAYIGNQSASGRLILNRSTVIDTTKTLTFGTGTYATTQTVAWNTSTEIWYQQIVNPPADNDPYTTTATVNTLIANSLTNYATQSYVNSQGFITSSALTGYATQSYVTTRGYITTASLSVTTAASGTSALSYFNGVFTFTPPNLSAYLTTVTNVAYANTATNLVGGIGVASIAGSSGTSVSASTGAVTVWFNTSTLVATSVYAQTFNTGTLVANAVNAQSATTATNAGYAYSFNTGTLVTTAVTANSVAGGYVSSITAGTGTQVSASTGAVTIWTLPAQAITSTATTTASNYTLDLSGPTFVAWQPSANGNRTITLTGFTPGRKVEMFITPHATNDIFTVNGVTTTQCSNGKNTFTMNGVGASQQSSFILQFYCTTNAIGGVWIYGNGSL